MRPQRAFWIIAAVSVALALAAYGVRGIIEEALSLPSGADRSERDRVVAEMIGALDFDPRVRRPDTRRLVEQAAEYSADPSLQTAETWYALGLREYYGESDASGAREAFARARAARPDWAWPVNGLAIVEFISGQRDAALGLFEEALRLEPGWSRPHADMAILLRRSGDVPEALEHARAALEIEPGHPINHYNLGVILDELGRHAEAREEYLRTIAIAPELAQAHYNLACSYAREGDVERALPALDRAISIEPLFRADAETDPDFGLVRGDGRFRAVVVGGGVDRGV